MDGQDNNNGSENKMPLDDKDHGQIESLKGEIKNLHDTIGKMLDEITQVTQTQNKLAKAALTANSTAEAAMAEMAKTKNELALAKTEMQQTLNAALPAAIKQGMSGFAEEVKKATDERITAILGSQDGQTGTEGQPAQSQVMVRQGSNGSSITDLIGVIMQNADGISKLVAAFKPAVPPVAPLADQLTSYLKLQKVIGDLTNANVDIEKFHKAATEALKPGTASQSPA